MSKISDKSASAVHVFETGVQSAVEAGMCVRNRTGIKGIALSRILGALAILALGSLGWFSLHLAATRIFQVDECCNVFVATCLAHGGNPGAVDVFQFLLSWLAHGVTRSIDVFISARFVMLEIFWLNLFLLASATGERPWSRRWLAAFLGAATLAPLWDYGFEVRHDNVLLTGMLFSWYLVRAKPLKMDSFFVLGAGAVGLEFVASKAFVYTLPLSAAVLACPPPGASSQRWKRIAFWVGGALSAALVLRVVLDWAGLWDDYFSVVQGVAAVPNQALRFWPWKLTLSRLLLQTPLLLALCAAAGMALASDFWRRKRAALNWDGNLPEALLAALAFSILFVNPNPYPYNLLHVVPYAFLLAWRYASRFWDSLPDKTAWVPAAAALVVFTHFVPFGVATKRHLNWTNDRQGELMNLAEDMTDPAKDPVYDAIGMVPTRPIVDPRAFLHGQSVENLINGGGPQVWEMLAANPPAVIIPSYRTDWLPKADHDFIRQRYVAVADDFLVLGKVLPKGGGAFEVYHAGRYRISPLKASGLMGTYFEPKNLAELVSEKPETPPPPLTGTLDGKLLPVQPVELSVGSHQIKCASDQEPAIVWMGPKLVQLPKIGSGNHDLLFYNWY